jgi:Fe-S cluster assembly protein SufD
MSDTATSAAADFKPAFDAMKNAGARSLRQGAWDAFLREGLPNRRVESWHYTDLRAALRSVAPLRAAEPATPVLKHGQESCRLVVLDGAFRPDLSDLSALPYGVSALSLRAALAQGETEILAALAGAADDPALALNAALMQDGAVLRVSPGCVLERPLELANFVSGGAAHSVYTRSLAILGAGAGATLLESFTPLERSGAQENHALILVLGAGAKLGHVATISPQGEDAVRVVSLLPTLGESSALNSFCLVEGGGLLRRQIFATLIGANADVSFSGASLLRNRDHADTTLVLRHEAPGGKSREFFRHIVDDTATGVFQGKVSVAPLAQKTDGAMQSKTLLLSDGASMNNKPELEIFADDVVCGHGATCGRLDADQLFYLEARGLPLKEAEALLVEGFAREAFESLNNEALREELFKRVGAWIGLRKVGI